MGKGFDTFMENPYWRKIYEEAPSEYLKQYYRIMFDTSPFVLGDDYIDEEAEARLKEMWISKEELEYLKEHAGIAQAKVFYQRCINKLNEQMKRGFMFLQHVSKVKSGIHGIRSRNLRKDKYGVEICFSGLLIKANNNEQIANHLIAMYMI